MAEHQAYVEEVVSENVKAVAKYRDEASFYDKIAAGATAVMLSPGVAALAGAAVAIVAALKRPSPPTPRVAETMEEGDKIEYLLSEKQLALWKWSSNLQNTFSRKEAVETMGFPERTVDNNERPHQKSGT